MESPEIDDAPADAVPTLTVRVGSETYTVAAGATPAVIGRPDPHAEQQPYIRIADDRISRAHLVLDVRDGQWRGQPKGKNGVFVNGAKVEEEFVIPEDGLTAVLGHPTAGKAVYFSTLDPALVSVGAQVARRRQELDLSQRTLAHNNVMNAGALISFEKGRSWPREGTRAKLEDALGWPRGRIAQLRRDHGKGAASTPADDEGERTEQLAALGSTTTIEVKYMAETVGVALASIQAQIDGLPDPAAPQFQSRVTALITDLSRLEDLATNASRGAGGAGEIIRQLMAVRRAHRDLMLLAAKSPYATLGQKLFVARNRSQLTVEEAAAMVGLSADDVRNAEAGATMTEPRQAALNQLLAALQ